MNPKAAEWAHELPAAITVTDAYGVIVEMNARSVATFEKSGGAALIGQDVRACHPPAASAQIDQLMAGQGANHYTIRKDGQRKIIHQLPWFKDGQLAGLVEIAIPIPDELPHFERG